MTILCYHSVQPEWHSPLAVTPAAFERHCRWLARRRRVLALPDAIARLNRRGILPHGLAALTFDDGFADFHDCAFPILARHGLPATVFLVAETFTPAGRAVDWVDDPPPHPLRTLSLDQVLQLRDQGVHFASHSYSHHDLTTLAERDCEQDLRASRELLEDLLGERVDLLAYPRGRHDQHVRRAAERAGYSHAFSLSDGPEPVGPLAVPRAGVYRGNTTTALRTKSARWYLRLRTTPVPPLARAARRRGPMMR